MLSWVWVHSSVKLNKFHKKKCCANGALSSVSHNFDEELKIRFGMDEMPLFMKLATTRHKFCQDCTKYKKMQWLLQKEATIVTLLIYKSRSRPPLCDAEWMSSSFLYKGIQIQPTKLWFIRFLFLTVWRQVHVCPNLEM